MAEFELIMPKMGESVAEATITRWLKEEGESIDLEESVLEIATDKVDSEVPSPVEGILKKKLFNVDDVVQVGTAIAIIEIAGESAGTTPAAATESAPAATPQQAAVQAQEVVETAQAIVGGTMDIPSRTSEGRFYSPLVRSIAQEEGVSLEELDRISGTGNEGRVSKADLLNYLKTRGTAAASASPAAPAPAAPSAPKPSESSRATPAPQPKTAPPVALRPGDEIIEMDRMRRIIAENMLLSKQTSPHVTSFVEADVTNIVMWRDKVKNQFLQQEGEKLTFTPIFIEAIVKAIRDFPMINISVDGNNIIKRKDINIGMATALPSGNLIVPVIKNADQLNLVGITKRVNDLANRARNNKLNSDDIQGGSYSISNVGSFGNLMGTPIIPQPQVAIMAVGAIKKKPVVLETPQGDVIAVRHMMFLSHSYDHRVVDGALGGMFVRRVADYLEQFDINREF
ncbi:MAG: 2-oxo acid dehydrogenase subunit E2 [Flavobacteriales bacterium]|nr:MAG: 2-oxo acid dehydrogenase subunit E2 [Flavobacteriales bacterium]